MKKIIKIKTDKLFSNITTEVSKFAKEWGKSGIVNVFSKHTTFCVWCTEDELLHKVDVRFFLDKLAPIWKDPEGEQKNIKYLHDIISLRNEAEPSERINGHSHIRSMLFSSSETIPVEKGELVLGTYKKIFGIELDGIRDREIVCSFIEE